MQDVRPRAGDAQFLRTAAEAGLTGAFMGELAERKGGERIRRVAHDVSADFRWFNQALSRIALGQGVAIPRELNAETRAAFDELATLEGPDFDRVWTSRTLEAQRAAAAALKAEASAGSYPEIRNFAELNLVHVEQRILRMEDTAPQAGRITITGPGIE